MNRASCQASGAARPAEPSILPAPILPQLSVLPQHAHSQTTPHTSSVLSKFKASPCSSNRRALGCTCTDEHVCITQADMHYMEPALCGTSRQLWVLTCRRGYEQGKRGGGCSTVSGARPPPHTADLTGRQGFLGSCCLCGVVHVVGTQTLQRVLGGSG